MEAVEVIGEATEALEDVGKISDGIHGQLHPSWANGVRLFVPS